MTLVTSNWLSLYTVFTSGVKILAHDCKQDYVILCDALFYSPQLSYSTKETSQHVSSVQKTESKDDSNTKEDEKKDTTDNPAASTEEKKAQEETKDETKHTSKQDSEVKEEKSGEPKKKKRKLDKPKHYKTFCCIVSSSLTCTNT